MPNPWPAYAEINADGYRLRDVARRIAGEFPGAVPNARYYGEFRTMHSVQFRVSEERYLDMLHWVDANAHDFEFPGPLGGQPWPPTVRARIVNADVRWLPLVRGGRRVWRGSCEIETELEDLVAATRGRFLGRTALTTFPHAPIADGGEQTFRIHTERQEMTDGAFRQLRLGEYPVSRRSLSFHLAGSFELFQMRNWAMALEKSDTPITFAGEETRIAGGIGGIEYTAEIRGGRRQWRAQLEVIGQSKPRQREFCEVQWGADALNWGAQTQTYGNPR